MAQQLRQVWDVKPRNDGRWVVQRERTKRADSVHASKDAAVMRCVALAKRYGAQVRINGQDGRIQDERTYIPAEGLVPNEAVRHSARHDRAAACGRARRSITSLIRGT